VLRMIEAYLGEDVFRDGVRLYLKRFAGGSATANDFWRALDDASGQDVTRVARTWVDVPGHPIVELRPSSDGNVSLRQHRFFTDPDAARSDQRWPIPMVMRDAHGERRVLFDADETTIPVRGKWLFPNARAAGFYRFALAPGLRDALLANVGQLDPVERLLLVDNDWALFRAGVIVGAAYLTTLGAFTGEQDRAVLSVIAEQLQWLGAHAIGPAARDRFASLVSRLFKPTFLRLGWDARRGESEEDQELRSVAIRMLGDLADDADVRAEAHRRIGRHLDEDRQEPNLIEVLAAVAARDGDVALHARYLARLREAAQTDPQDEQNFRTGLASFDDGAAVAMTLASVDDGAIRDQDLADVYFTGMRNVAARERYWEHLRARYFTRIAPLEAMVRNSVLAAATQLTPPALAREADAFLASVAVGDSAEHVTRVREALRLASRAAQRMGRELEAVLATG